MFSQKVFQQKTKHSKKKKQKKTLQKSFPPKSYFLVFVKPPGLQDVAENQSPPSTLTSSSNSNAWMTPGMNPRTGPMLLVGIFRSSRGFSFRPVDGFNGGGKKTNGVLGA